MLRSILAVIAGYLVWVVSVVATMLIAYFELGLSFVYEATTTATTTAFCILMLGLALPCAAAAGYTAATIARKTRPVEVLALLVLVLGIAFSIPMLSMKPEPRTPEMPMEEIMQLGVHPRWYPAAQPVIGLTGVLLGGMLRRRVTAPTPSESPEPQNKV